MTPKLLLEAPTPLDYFASLVGDDAHLPLLEAAASIAQDDDAALDVQSVLVTIDGLAWQFKRRVPSDAVPLQRLRLLNRYFFQELGFGGNLNDYHDPRNSHLDAVLRSRRGIPITLALLYIEIARQIGLVAEGVSFPGHFLVKLRLRQGNQPGEVLIDPCNGHSLSREELGERLLPYRHQRNLPGDDDLPLALFLQSASARETLARMLRNLKDIHRRAQDWPRLLQVQRRMVVLMPDDWDERRDRGSAYARLGCNAEAAADFEAYLLHRPGAADRAAVAERLDALRRAEPPQLH